MKFRTAVAIVLALPTITTLESSERRPQPETARASSSINRMRVAESYGRLPLGFEANRGQTDERVKFVSRGPGYTLFLTPTEAVLALRRSADRASSTRLRMTLVDANPSPRIVGRDASAGESNYFVGRDIRRWRAHVPHFAKVEYEDIYPGVNLIYYGNQQQLEFDFVVGPGANPELIALTFDGASQLRLDVDGAAVLSTGEGEIRLRKPVIYQDVNGKRNEIPGGYVLKGDRTIAFRMASYDRARPLVVDPVLVYSTYLGGSIADFASGIAVDQDGAAYVVGHTVSLDFPTTTSSVQPFCSTYTDETGTYCDEVFVTKLSSDGTAIVYSTYLGGTYDDVGNGIAVDREGNAYITGSTRSLDFPTVNAVQPMNRNEAAYFAETFVAKLSPDGSALLYSTYLGGGQHDVGNSIAVDSEGSAYVTGMTSSSNFPTAGSFATLLYGPTDAYITKLTPDGSALVYSRYVGDQGTDNGNAIAVDGQGYASITGETSGPVSGGVTSYAFVMKVDAGARLVYHKTLATGAGHGIAVDAGHTYVTGTTAQLLQPVAALQPAGGGQVDAFVAKLDFDGRVVYATYLGGSDSDRGSAIAVDPNGNCVVAGLTVSADFPTVNPLQGPGGEVDLFIAKINPQGTALLFSTYLGGSGRENDSSMGERQGPALAVNPDQSGNSVYVAGYTDSPDFPTAAPLQADKAGYVGAFVAKIFDDPNDRADLAVAVLGPIPLEADLGTHLSYAFRVTNHGPAEAPAVTLTDQLPAGADFEDAVFFSDTTGGGACARDGDVVSCQLGALPAGVTALVQVVVTPTAPGMLVNTASVTSTTPDEQPANNSVITNTIVRDLSVTDTGGAPAEVQVGEQIGYLLVVANNGPAYVTDVQLIDQLPDGVVVREARIFPSFMPPGSCPHDNHFVVCQVGIMPAGATFTVSVIVTAMTPGTLINTATVLSNEREGNLANNTVETRTTATRPAADLSIAIAASPNPVQLGGTVTYTFDVTNLGPSTASDVILTDTLSGQERLVSATGPSGSCTGTSVIACNLGAVSSGQRVRVTVQTTAIRIPDMARTFDNTAVVTTAAADPNPANNSAGIVMNVNTPPIANAGPDQVVAVGATCQATVTLNGTGSSDPEGDALTYTWTTEDLLPPPIVFSSGSSGGAVTGPTPTGSMPAGAFTILLTVSDGNGGTATDTVTITARDVTGPLFSNVPGPIVAEQSSPAGALVALGVPSAVDNCSGTMPVSSDAPVIFPPGTTTVRFTAADSVGNTATIGTTVTVVDTIAPVIQILSPEARDYTHADVLVVSVSATDTGSGLMSGSPESWLDGVPVAGGQGVALLTFGLGEHVFTTSAMDAAGNPVVRTVTFRIVATIDSLIAGVNLFEEQGQIGSPTARSLLGKLNDAKQAALRGRTTVAINKLNDLIDYVTAQVGQHITSEAAEVLMTDARYVIGTLQ